MWLVFFERENNSKDVWRGGPHLFCFPLHWTYRLFSLHSHLVPPYSLYLDSFSLGMMFMDCSSWKSSLQAYGMRSEDTWQDDLQKWHLKPKSAALEDSNPGAEAARRRGRRARHHPTPSDWGRAFPSPQRSLTLSNLYVWAAKRESLSGVRLPATPWTVARQAPLSMKFSGQEYWSGLPFPSPNMYVYTPGIKRSIQGRKRRKQTKYHSPSFKSTYF